MWIVANDEHKRYDKTGAPAMQQTLASHDTLRRTVRISSTGLLWLAVVAPTMFSSPYCSPALADPGKVQKSSGGSPGTTAANPPPQAATTTGLEETGGTVLVYQVEKNGKEPLTDELMERLVAGIARRVQASNSEVTSGGVVAQYLSSLSKTSLATRIKVRRVGQDQVEVQIPGTDAALLQQTKRRIAALGTLEFAILANRRDHEKLFDFDKAVRDPQKTVVVDEKVAAVWREVASKMGADGKESPGRFTPDGEIVVRPVAGRPEGFLEVLVVNEPNEARRITGKLLKRSYVTADQSGGPAVGFTFNAEGGRLFSDFTRANQPKRDGFKRRLAIVLDNRIVTASSLNSIIGESGIIEGNFARPEVDETVAILNAGALPTSIKKNPLSEFTVVPRAGPNKAPAKTSP